MASSPDPFFKDYRLKNTSFLFHGNSIKIQSSLYLIILCLLGFIFTGMALLKIPVFVKARGIIRPSTGICTLKSPVSGMITEILVNENQMVRKGDPLLRFDTAKERVQKHLLLQETEDIRERIVDLGSILSPGIEPKRLKTDKYKSDHSFFLKKNSELDLRIQLTENELARVKKLYASEFASEKEFEEAEARHRAVLAEKELFVSENRKRWIDDLISLHEKETSLKSQLSEISHFLEESEVNAPVNGVIQGIRDRFRGEYLAAGKDICKLVPDTSLIAEIFIHPKDAGFIRKGQLVRLLIDSYDFRYWGTVQARCESISDDVEQNGDQAAFRITCSIGPSAFLEYSGLKVRPGKGMTLTAQFIVTYKNIWQLVFDHIDDLISGGSNNNQRIT